MSNGYESTEAFLQGIEDELRGDNPKQSGRANGGYNDRERRRRHDEDDDGERSSSRRHRGEGDYYEDGRNRRSGGGGHSSRRPTEDRDSYSRRHERDFYPHDHHSGGGYRSDRYDRGYSGGSGRRGGNEERRSRGGGGGWRDGPVRENSPANRRSPTPPGTRPISERIRKNSKWNIPPEGFENVSPMQAKATGLFGIPGQSRTLGVQANVGSGRDAKGNLIGTAGMSGAAMPMASATATDDPASGNNVQGATQSNRQARRLYVGNIGFNATEDNLNYFFNEQMRKMNFTIEEGDPVISTQVNNEKGYAFIELRSVTEATNAMSFDGIIFQGQSIKIRRPKDYVGPNPHPPAKLHVPGVISTNVPDGPNKIYIGGLPTYLVEEQVIELLKSFGELRSFNLVRESGVNGASKGYAFCEYVDVSITDLAIQGLNDMELGDKKLLVQRASVGTTAQRTNAGTGANTAPLATGANGTALIAPTGAVMEGGLNGSEGGTGEPTKAMMLLNCVTAEELVDDEEYQEIVEDMRDECSKYGTVVDMRIPRPDAASKGFAAQAWRQQSKTISSEEEKEREGVGRVYVLFEDPSDCQKALQAIAGRQFAGRTVIAAFIAENSFPSDEDGGRDARETTEQATKSV